MAICNSNKKQHVFFLASLFFFTLAGCGGGDSDSDAADTVTDAADTVIAVVITEANMVDVASGVIMANSATSLGASGPGLLVGVETNTIEAPTGKLLDLAVGHAKAMNSKLATQDFVVGAQGSETVDCTFGGTVSVSYNIQSDTGTLTAGDSLNATFSNCQEDLGSLNGGMSLSINSFTGDFNPSGSMNISAVFSKLSISSDQTQIIANGDMRIAASFDSVRGNISVLANSIGYSITSSGKSISMTLRNLNLTAAEDSQKVEIQLSQSFTASFPTFSGSGDVSTLFPLVEYWTTGIASGKFKVAGHNSTLYITFMGGESVLLELDTGNDGIIDASKNKSLSELDPLVGMI